MPYFANSKCRYPIAYGRRGTQIYKLSELPKIEFPEMIRVTECHLEIDDIMIPHALMQKKTMLWLQRMWRIWSGHHVNSEATGMLTDAMEALVEELECWHQTLNGQNGGFAIR